MQNTIAESKRRYSGDGPETQHFRMQRRKSLPGNFAYSNDGLSLGSDLNSAILSRDNLNTAYTNQSALHSYGDLHQTWDHHSGGSENIAIQSHVTHQTCLEDPSYSTSLQAQLYSQESDPSLFGFRDTMIGLSQPLPGTAFPNSFHLGSAPADSRLGNVITSSADLDVGTVIEPMTDAQHFDSLGKNSNMGYGQFGLHQQAQQFPWSCRGSVGSDRSHSTVRDCHIGMMATRTYQQPVMGAQCLPDQTKMRFEAPRQTVDNLKNQVPDPTCDQKSDDDIILDEDVLSISHAFSDDDISIISAIEPPRSAEPKFVLTLALPEDERRLSGYQILLRQSLEYFSATKEDVETRVRGRKQKIRLGQIGIRCRYCAHLRIRSRGKGAVYFPHTLINVYQAAQNISAAHFSCERYICPFVPITLVEDLDDEKPRKNLSKGGRAYWIEACKKAGIVEKDRALWLQADPATAILPDNA